MDRVSEFVDSMICCIDEIRKNKLNPNKEDDSYKNLDSYSRLKIASENVNFNTGVIRILFQPRIKTSEHLDEIIIRLHEGNWHTWRRLWFDAPGGLTSGLKFSVDRKSPFRGFKMANPYARGGDDYIQELYKPVIYSPPV